MTEKISLPLDITEIQNILPHRPPFLLIDRVMELEEDTRAVAIKNVTMNEPFFTGHFPGQPVMPGVLIVEAMAQTGAVLLLTKEEHKGKIVFFMGIDNVKFRKPVVPGDTLKIQITVLKIRSTAGKIKAEAFVDENLVCEAEMSFALPKR